MAALEEVERLKAELDRVSKAHSEDVEALLKIVDEEKAQKEALEARVEAFRELLLELQEGQGQVEDDHEEEDQRGE